MPKTDDESDLERQWWAHPVTQQLWASMVAEHTAALTALRMQSRDTTSENLAAIKYVAGVTDTWELALGAMKARDGEEDTDE